MLNPSIKTYRFKDLHQLLNVSRSTIWRWVREGKFPPPVQLGPNVKAWRETDLQNWLDSQADSLNY